MDFDLTTVVEKRSSKSRKEVQNIYPVLQKIDRYVYYEK